MHLCINLSLAVEAVSMLSYDDFQKLDLRVAKIVAAEKIAGSDKLLKLQVDVGNEKRQIVAGIAQKYSADELVDKNIIILANLEPRKLRGIESQGMLLAAVEGDNTVLLTTDKEISAGAKVC
jgi:methionine--tRNA ligase beta chain